MSKADWHYPRTEFADKVYNLLANGPIQGISIFGPRRTGKTQFLTHDLAPLAEQKGHKVVYASLWQTQKFPLAILLYEFDRTLNDGSFMNRVKSIANDLGPKFKVRMPDGSADLEIDLSKINGKPPIEHFLLLDQYCERLASNDKPAFLLLDEFQELEKAEYAADLIAGLRTSLDKRRDGLVAVFTGSAQAGLRQVFSVRHAPFFRFAIPIDLPIMEEEFVVHQLKAFHIASKATIEKKKAIEIFRIFNGNPLFFQRWLMKIAIYPHMSESDAIDVVQAELAEEFGFNRLWLGLNSNQRIMARMVAMGIEQVYGKNGSLFIENFTGKIPPSKSALQSAIERLSRLGIVDKWDKEWRIGDPLFESWIKNRPSSEF